MHERKNKDLKCIGAQHRNTSTFEKSVVRQAANQQLATLRERRSFGDHLQCVREIDGVKYALKVQSSGILWTKGDVVLSDADCGVVELACAADDQLLLYVRSYTLQEMRSPTTSRWREGGVVVWTLPRTMRHASAWTFEADCMLVIGLQCASL